MLRRGAAVIYKPQTKYVQVLSDIRLLQSHCGVCCCNLEMALRQMPLGSAPAAPTARPQRPPLQAGEPEWADRSVRRWLPEFVFYNLNSLNACFSLFIPPLRAPRTHPFFGSTHVAAATLIARKMRDQTGTITKRFIFFLKGSVGS